MSEHLDHKLSSANPISEEKAAGLIPPAVGEAMLREITATPRNQAGWRFLAPIFGSAGQARARAGFVAVLGLLVLAAIGLNSLSGGQDDGTDLAEAADDAEPVTSIEVTTTLPEPSDGSAISVVTPEQAPPSSNTSVTTDPEAGTSDTEGQSTITSPADEQTTTTESAPPTTTETTIEAPGQPTAGVPCVATGNTLNAAILAYAQQCEGARADCDNLSGQWLCSDQQLGDEPSGFGPAQYFGDCIAIQAELFPLVGDWQTVDDPAASNGTYLVWDGPDDGVSHNKPTDVISVNFSIDTPGMYRFVWRMRQPDDVSANEANDTWVDFPDADRFGPTSGGTYGGFVKVLGYGTDDFVWTGKADEGLTQSDIAIEFDRSGTYTLNLAGRSPGHQIDRIIVYPEYVNRGDATAGNC